MFHGGTNFGFMNGGTNFEGYSPYYKPIATSYGKHMNENYVKVLAILHLIGRL